MKSINCILIYFGLYIGFFYFISLAGMPFGNYLEIIQDKDWFMVYSLLLGWWLPILPVIEYTERNKNYFKKHNL